jgi:hypothetical protein
LGLAPADPPPPPSTTRPATLVDFVINEFRAGKYAAAAVDFRDLSSNDPSRPSYLYLEGKSLALCGDSATGNRLMHEASLIPLGDPAWRFELVKALHQAGLDEEARQQADLATRFGTWFEMDGFGLVSIYRFQGDEAAAAGHWKEAAERYDRAVLSLQISMGGNADLGEADYLTLPAAAHLMHARDWWDRHDKPKSLAELERHQIYFPLDPGPAIEFVNKLDTAGDRAEADKRCDATWNRLTALIAKYPKSPVLNANAAKLANGCGRHREDGLRFAQAADAWQSTAETRALIQSLRNDAATTRP